MADSFNPHQGGDASELAAAAAEMRVAAREARAAAQAARRAGVEPSSRQIEQEAARARQREQAYEKPLTQAAQARKDAELKATKSAQGKASADDRATAATRRKAAADDRLAAILNEQAAMAKAAGLRAQATLSAADQVARASRAGAQQDYLARAGVGPVREPVVAPPNAALLAAQRVEAAAKEAERASLSTERRIAGLLGPGTPERVRQAPSLPIGGDYRRRFVVDPGGVATQGGYGSGPPPPPRPPTGTGGLPPDDDSIRRTNAYRNALGEANAGIQRNTAFIGANSDAMRRHGALTTEFIQAAARGEAGYREWGYQIGATAAKFAGWTAVSIPVFAALDGVRQIGKGAIDSASGVNQLQRVLNNTQAPDFGAQAQGAFRGLSSDFNVPIKDAADAVYLMGQRFHDLPEAVTAARAALYSFKTGGVDVETGAKNLIAITNGFQLGGNQLLEVFNQINQAQNRFGTSISDIELAVAKAGGTFRNAGGDASYLISLIGTGMLAGRTSGQVSTAVQRSAGFVQRPTNQAALRSFGIDPTQSINQVYESAFKAVSRGADAQAVATALSSPQLAASLIPILNNRALFQKFQRETSPAASRDSAQRELQTVLGSPSEALHKFGNELQRFGSAFAQSGFLAAAVGVVKGLTGIVAVTNRVLEAFNRVPPAVQAMLVGFSLVRGSQLIGRRLGVGEGTGGFFGRTPEQQARIAVQQALRENQQYLQSETQAFGGRARRAFLTQSISTRVAQDAEARGPGDTFDTNTQTLRRETEQEYRARLGGLKEQANLAGIAARDMERQRAVMDELSRDQVRLQAQYREAVRRGTVLRFAEAQGLYVNPTQNRPSSPTEPGQVRGGQLPGAGAAAAAARRAEAAGQAIIPGLARQEAALVDESAVQKAVAVRQGSLVNAFREARAASGTATATAVTLATTASNAGVRAANTGRALSNAARSITGSIGGFGLTLIGIQAAVAAGEALADHFKKQGDQYDRISATPYSTKQRQDEVAEARKIVDEERAKARKRSQSNDPDVARNDYNAYLGDSDRYKAALARVNEEVNRARINRSIKARGGVVPDATRQDVEGDFRDIERQFNAGTITVDQRSQALGNLLREIDASGNIAKKAKAFLTGRVQAAQAQEEGPRGLVERFFGGGGVDLINTTQVDKDLDALFKLAATPGAKAKDLDRIFTEGIARSAGLATDRSVTGRAAYAERIQSIVQGIEGNAKDELDRTLGLAKSQDDRDRAYRKYQDTVGGADNRLVKQLHSARTHYRQTRADLTDINQSIADARQTGEPLAPLLQRREQIEAAVKSSGGEQDRIRKALKDYRAGVRDKLTEIARQQFDEDEAFREAQVTVQAYAIQPGVGRASFLLHAIQARVTRAIRVYGRDSKEVLDLTAQQQQAQDAVIQEQARLIDAQTSLSTANAGTDQGAQSKAQIAGLQRKLAFEQAHPHTYGKADLTDLAAQIQQARNSALEQARQDANDVLRAQYALRESRTDDPVEIARLEYQLSEKVLARGGFKNAAEKINQQAEVNRNRRAYEQAGAQSKYDDIEFYASIGKYTADQEISALQRLEHTLKGNKTLKRTIQQRVYELTHGDDQSNLDLNLDNVRIPTLYEIRRSIGLDKAGTSVTNRNTATVVVNSADDVPAVMRVMERHNSGIGRAAARARGDR